MKPQISIPRTSVSAYFSLGSEENGVCTKLLLLLQTRNFPEDHSAQIIPFPGRFSC
ncbi:hypothetical protein [Roseobacter ponti]|uniref:Uncharacterized protein n=1 Tax=Roseobacter ponti TaxID=1891787 RepID=A0A858SPX5_9RHOB|nr:hypothetical protein [Roseobacter ponti]QJF50889.1 hypothetical protein G3256_06810 [Roseobacter ponti]